MALVLGPGWARDLSRSPYRLSFKLSAGEAYVTMFTTAYDRARVLARAAFRGDEPVGVIAANPDPRNELNAKWHGWKEKSAFDYLGELGVCTKDALVSWNDLYWLEADGTEDEKPWLHRAAKLTWDQADILLWNQIAQEIGVAPRAPVHSKLVDLKRGLALNIYDDRGMDITSLTQAPLGELYEKFNDWLLDFDRGRMKTVFES